LRAGLWPRLARDDLNFLPLPVVRPQIAAISGRSGLAVALATTFSRFGEPRALGVVKETLALGPDGFSTLLDEISALARRRLVGLDEARPDPTVILPLDQAEELFNSDGRGEAETFLDLIATMLTRRAGAGDRRLLVVATMRSDRYELLQGEPRLSAVKQDLFNLPPLQHTEFKSVIEGPRQRVVEAGGRLLIDPALTERLVAESQGADALPLLGFTLQRLYRDYGNSGRLTLAEYDTLGGVQGAIEAAVAAALAEPGRAPNIPSDRETQLSALRAAFIPWLARIDPESTAPMRRVASRSEIPEGSRTIVDRLIEVRLLVADRRGAADVIEVAHESLLRQWPALGAWLAADAADLQLVDGIERAAGEWNRNGRLEAWLIHRNGRLIAAERLTTREDFLHRLGESGAAYLSACRIRQVAEQTRSQRLRRRVLQVTIGAAVVFFGASLVSGWLYYRAEGARREADQQRDLAVFTSDTMTRISGSASNEAMRLSESAATVVQSSSLADRVRVYLDFATHYGNAWDGDRATKALEKVNALIEELKTTSGDPKQNNLLRGYSHEIAGDIKWTGNDAGFKISEDEYKESLALLTAAGAPAADLVRVRCKLARAKLFEGWVQDAETELRQTEASLTPNSEPLERALIDDVQADLLLRQGDTERAAAKFAEAISIFNYILKSDPGNSTIISYVASAFQKYGDLQRRAGNPDALTQYLSATEFFNKVLQDNPTSFAGSSGLDLTRHSIRLLNSALQADAVEEHKSGDLATAINSAFASGIGRFRFGLTIQDVNQLLVPPFSLAGLKNLPTAWEYRTSEVRYFWRWITELPDFYIFTNNEECMVKSSYVVFMFHDERLFRIVVRVLNDGKKCPSRERFIDDFAARYRLTPFGSSSERRIRYQNSNVAITGFGSLNTISLDFIQR
jgi:tetratricopeptide (TPR) repeat protein